MPPTYRIHPAIGIARLGNSPTGFYLSPETPAAVPTECDADGNPLFGPDGTTEKTVTTFKDDQGRVKRQAARFQIYVYDDDSPEGRPLQLGDTVEGGGNAGKLVDIQWRAYPANKKAAWYQFQQRDGEHGYSDDHPLRNPNITDPDARQALIVDSGPRTVNCTSQRRAHFSRHDGGLYPATFPPPLSPHSIDTLGEMFTDDAGRLLFLGGHGNSGSMKTGFSQPRIDTYANNDGWFDDTSDGPVMARLVLYSPLVGATRYVDVEAPAWVIVGYPRYVPPILDMITLDEAIYDMAVREFADRPDMYGPADGFADPKTVDPTDTAALAMWRAGRLRWNPNYKPWFYRDIWTILFRPDEYDYLTDILGQSNYPHNQSTRGSFDPERLGCPPRIDTDGLAEADRALAERHASGELFATTLAAALAGLHDVPPAYARGLRLHAATVHGDPDAHLVDELVRGSPEKVRPRVAAIGRAHLEKQRSGRLLAEARRKLVAEHTIDPERDLRQFLFDLLRRPGDDNRFAVTDRPGSRVQGLPLMPLLAGDNPISNTLPAKFLTLTPTQYFLLSQWVKGCFYNEKLEGWADPDAWNPYAGVTNRTGRDLDRNVLSNLLGGAFCPGGEVSWIIRNPAIYTVPYRVKADPAFSAFRLLAAQANSQGATTSEDAYNGATDDALSVGDTDFETGLQPGDLTKYGALPWQSDFNECTTQDIDITYQDWNQLPVDDPVTASRQRAWTTLWWPAHRPLQTQEIVGWSNGSPLYQWFDWARGIPQTNAGDLRMVTEWWRLGFVVRNPYQESGAPTTLPPDQKYISVERTERKPNEE